MRCRLRTLLTVLALGTMLLATAWQYREFFWEDRPSAREFDHPPGASQSAEVYWQRRLEQVNAEIAELRAKYEAELAELSRAHELRKEFRLYELSRSDRMEAKPGIYFLGPELLLPVHHH